MDFVWLKKMVKIVEKKCEICGTVTPVREDAKKVLCVKHTVLK
jgi:hypothetical protein